MVKANQFVMAMTAGVAPGASTAATINNAAGGAVTLATIPVGAAAIVSAGLTRATITAALAAASEYYFVKNVGGKLIHSPAFTATAAEIALTKKNEVFAAGASSKVMIKTITTAKLKCESEYMLKLRFESPCIMKTYGYQDFVKTISYTTGCCADPCVDCGTYVQGDFADELVIQINLQAAGLVTATATGADITIETIGDSAAALACGLDPMECSDYNVQLNVGLEGAFECSGATVVTAGTGTTAYSMTVGGGRSIAALGAWASGYYRDLGTVRGGFPYITADNEADASINYDFTTFTIKESAKSAATMADTVNSFEVVIAYKTGATALDAGEVNTLLG